MLAKAVARRYGGRVAFVEENFGESELAERFGVRRYPAIFVNDVLVAKPKDFGFLGEGGAQGEGRYTPFRDAASHERFQRDLARMVDLALAGDRERLARAGVDPGETREIGRMPELRLTDLNGRSLTSTDLEGRIVLVEFWATWCPPCRSTLAWLGKLARESDDRVAVLALAVESPETDVRSAAAEIDPAVLRAIGTPETAAAFGDVTAVPTLFLFDRHGRTAEVYYGTPPDLHERIERRIGELLAEAGLE